MKEIRMLICVPMALLALMALQSSEAATKPNLERPSSVDPKAKEILRQMSDYLSALNSFKAHVQTTREVILPSSQELDSDQMFDVHVLRPDHVRVDVQSAAGQRHFFYDGKTVTIYTPKLKYYAVIPAPSTIDEMFREAASKYGLEMPIADFVISNPYNALTNGASSGMYVGKSLIDGTSCNHLAFRQKNLDWQVWIEDGTAPLPRKFVITDRARDGTPRFTAMLSGWNVNPSFDVSIFTFTPGEGDRKISIVQMEELKRKKMSIGKSKPCR